MNKPITILDKDYLQWVSELSKRYRQSQVKAAVKVNTEMLKFYWSLGRDIVALKGDARWGSKFLANLSRDLKKQNPGATCFSSKNLLYMKNFYYMYLPYFSIGQQVADQLENNSTLLQNEGRNSKNEIGQQLADQLESDIFATPWEHHILLIDKFLNEAQKALFYVHQTVTNGWSRSVLYNFKM